MDTKHLGGPSILSIGIEKRRMLTLLRELGVKILQVTGSVMMVPPSNVADPNVSTTNLQIERVSRLSSIDDREGRLKCEPPSEME